MVTVLALNDLTKKHFGYLRYLENVFAQVTKLKKEDYMTILKNVY